VSGTTYLVVGQVSITASTTFQPATTLKFDRNAYLYLSGSLTCPSDNQDFAVLTARDDDTVGESTTTGTLSGFYAYPALSLYNVSGYGTGIKRLEIRYAQIAIQDYSGNGHTVSRCLFDQCQLGIGAYYTPISINTSAMYDVATRFSNYGYSTFYNSGILVGNRELNALKNAPAIEKTKNQAEPAVAINPLNPNNVVIVATRADSRTDQGTYLPRMISIDGGINFGFSKLATGTDLPVGRADPSLAYDKYGNLFVSYLELNDNTDVIVALSTDNGANFTQIMDSDGGRFYSDANHSFIYKGFPDQPTLVTGPSGVGNSESVWILFQRARQTYNPNGPAPIVLDMVVARAIVSGLGTDQVGSFYDHNYPCPSDYPTLCVPPLPATDPTLRIIGGATDCSFGDIAIGPNGQVITTFQQTGGQILALCREMVQKIFTATSIRMALAPLIFPHFAL